MDLRACCAEECAGAETAMYRLRACVHYCNRGDVPGAGVADKGHFTAFFRSGETWYSADDQNSEAGVRVERACPTKYPYLCFLERMGDAQGPLESLPPREVCLVEDAQGTSQPRRPRRAAPAEPAPKLRRLRGKQALAPCASAGLQTPAKRSLLSGGTAARSTKRRARGDPEHATAAAPKRKRGLPRKGEKERKKTGGEKERKKKARGHQPRGRGDGARGKDRNAAAARRPKGRPPPGRRAPSCTTEQRR